MSEKFGLFVKRGYLGIVRDKNDVVPPKIKQSPVYINVNERPFTYWKALMLRVLKEVLNLSSEEVLPCL